MDKNWLKSEIAKGIIKAAVQDLVDEIDTQTTTIDGELQTEINRVQTEIQSIFDVAYSTVQANSDGLIEYVWKGTVGGANDYTSQDIWQKIIVLNPPSGNVKLKQVSFMISTFLSAATPTADNWVGYIKFKQPYDYTAVNPSNFGEFAEPYYKIHPMCSNTGYNITTNELLAYPQAWGVPECELQIGTGGGIPEDNFHAPYTFGVNAACDYKLNGRGLQVWAYVTEPVSISVSFQYVSDGESVSNEA